MTSLRHNHDSSASPKDAYLDAARDCILEVGWKRTTLTEVARRAGVSRMTIYRSWADMPTLLGDLMTREWAGIVAAHGAHLEPEPEPLAHTISETIAALRNNDLFVRIVELDPELVLPYLLSRKGRSQQLIIDLVTERIAAGQESGAIRAGDPAAIARGLVLAAHGFVLSAHTMVEDDVTEADLASEFRTLLTRSLQP